MQQDDPHKNVPAFQELEADRIKDEYASGRLKWKNQFDEETPINEMSNRHINNVILMINRKKVITIIDEAWIDVFDKERARRLKQRNL